MERSLVRHHLVAVCAILPVAVAACTSEQFGLPRTPVSVVSPDGRVVAFVRNHPNIDPPSQSIWIGPVNADATQLRALGPDSDWCNTIVWSADGSTVAFLVQDARLIAVDAATYRIASEQWLTDWQGEYPPYQVVRELSLSRDGREARFRTCDRAVGPDGDWHAAANCGDLRTRTIGSPTR